LLLGTSLAAIVVPKLAVWAIENHGWRSMFAIVGMLPLLVALPLAFWLFREPRPEEQPPGIKTASGALTGVTLAQGLRDYRFWLIWASILIIALTFGGAFINMPAMLADRGIPAQGAASVMGILGLGILSGRIITGLLLDRFWAGFVAFPLLYMPFGVFSAISPIVYSSVRDATGSYDPILFYSIFGYIIGGALLLLGRYPVLTATAGASPQGEPAMEAA